MTRYPGKLKLLLFYTYFDIRINQFRMTRYPGKLKLSVARSCRVSNGVFYLPDDSLSGEVETCRSDLLLASLCKALLPDDSLSGEAETALAELHCLVSKYPAPDDSLIHSCANKWVDVSQQESLRLASQLIILEVVQ